MTIERTLHHFTLDPASRQVRLALAEKRLPYAEQIERYWERPACLAALNPSGLTPVLVESDGPQRAGDLRRPRHPRAPGGALSGGSRSWPRITAERAEARRLSQWFERVFDPEVNGYLLREKMEKRLTGGGSPDHSAMRAGRDALRRHLRVLEDLPVGVRDFAGGHATCRSATSPRPPTCR